MSERVQHVPHRVGRLVNPSVVGGLIIAGIVLLLVLNPLARLLISSLQDPDTGAFSLGDYAAAFGRTRYLMAYVNSIAIALAVAGLSAAMAVPLAWGVSRTDMPARGAVHLGVVGTFVVPPFIGAIAWILLGGPNAGWLNRIWRAITGAEQGPVNIFTFWGLAFVMALYAFPLIYIFVTNALDLIPGEMEDAAQIHGAGRWRTFWRVTLPLAAPAVLGSVIIVFLESVAIYGTSALIGIPAGINLVSTQLAAFFESPVRLEVASAFSMPLIAMTACLLGLQRAALAGRSYVTVGGKTTNRRRVRLRAGRWVLLAYAAAVLGLSFVLPTLVLLQTAFAKAWGQPMSLDNLTLENFRQILFAQPTVRQAIWNTFIYSVLAATGCTGLGFAVAYIAQRRVLPFAQVLSFLALSPFAVPGIVLAVCFYATYAAPPFALYGTGTLVMIAFVTRFLPIACTTSAAGVRSLNVELEEAAHILGGGRFRALGRIVAPLLKRTLLGAWILIFIVASRELSTAVFLTGPDSRVISVLTLDLSEQGQFEALAAMGLLLLVATGAVVAVAARLLGRNFMQAQD